MSWLARYYDRRARTGDGCDFLKQVGHSERGTPISPAQFETMVSSLCSALQLQPRDVLLDLCCGNGIFTSRIAREVGRVLALDFSAELIALARRHHSAANLTYHDHNVRRLKDSPLLAGQTFTKILMHAALQHFTASDLRSLLEALRPHAAKDSIFHFSYVPDAARRNIFLASVRPGWKLRMRRLLGRDLMGKWWHQSELVEIGSAFGLKVDFLAVDPSLPGAAYRFDIRMRS